MRYGNSIPANAGVTVINEGSQESVASIVERRAIYYRAFGIYSEIGGLYDYGPVGLRIRRNIEEAWRDLFVEHIGALEIETANMLSEDVLKASGHVAAFTDPVAICLNCKTPHRIDKLLEEFYEKKGDAKAAASVKKLDIGQLEEQEERNRLVCSKCGGKLSKIEKFNLMFKTTVGQGDTVVYLRPETAQSIFLDFKTIFRSNGLKLPAVICQIGRAYRNEISARQQLVRMREFTQMDTEIFFDPELESTDLGYVKSEHVLKTRVKFISAGEEAEKECLLADLLKEGKIPNLYFAYLIYLEKRLLERMGISEERYRFRQLEKEELPHYSKGNVDLEIATRYGYIEAAGNAHRGDFDLSNHAKFSGQDLGVINGTKKTVPQIIEATLGLDRLFFALLDDAFTEEGREWPWLRLNEKMAPYSYAIFPLQKDEKLIAVAQELHRKLLGKKVACYYTDTASIGKRYAKADEIGVPRCITVDFQTLEDQTVTVRDRNTTEQVRRKIDEIA